MKTLTIMLAAAVYPSLMQASVLGPVTASGVAYNLLVFGNDTQSGSDVYGPVAIGGSYNGNTTFASQISSPSSTYNIVIGKDFTLNGSQPASGSLFVGGNASVSGAALPGNLVAGGSVALSGGTVNGNVQYVTTFSNNNTTIAGTTSKISAPSSPLDFVSAQTSLQNLSSTLTATAATGVPDVNQYSHNVTLNVNQNGTNVFNLTAAQVAAMQGFTINDNGFTNVTVIVNVAANSSGADTLPNTGYSLNGISASNVLFNFSANTTTLNSLGGLYGSVLAPWAALNFSSNLNGQIIVSSLSGTGEIHSAMFTGALPNVTTVATPEPSTVFLLAGGLILLAVRKIRPRIQR